MPDNWFSHFKDIIRTKFTVRYLDGLTQLSENLKEASEFLNLRFVIVPEARPDGYYAYQCSVSQEYEITSKNWESQKIKAVVELQINTMLQDAIGDLLRKIYEKWRIQRPPDNWQWEIEKQPFRTNYLGHVLHYLDGQLMTVRSGDEE